jgi:hypothetical protein
VVEDRTKTKKKKRTYAHKRGAATPTFFSRKKAKEMWLKGKCLRRYARRQTGKKHKRPELRMQTESSKFKLINKKRAAWRVEGGADRYGEIREKKR